MASKSTAKTTLRTRMRASTSHQPLTTNHQLTWRSPLCIRIHRIERLPCGHEKSIAFRATEGDVGAHFRQTDAADQLAVGVPHRDAAVAYIGACVAAGP